MAIWGNKEVLELTDSTYNLSALGVLSRQSGAVNFTTTVKPGDSVIMLDSGNEYIVESITSATALQITQKSDVPTETATDVIVSQKPKHLNITERASTYGVDSDEEMQNPDNRYGQHAGWVKYTLGRGGIVSVTIDNAGTGYDAVPEIAVDDEFGEDAELVAVVEGGKVVGVGIDVKGLYTEAPDLTIDPPADQTFDTETDVDGTEDTITIVGHPYETGDEVIYNTDSGVETIGLTHEESYFVVVVDDDTFSLATSLEDATEEPPVVVDLTASGPTDGETHILEGVPASLTAVVGGRAGRVLTETYVAMSVPKDTMGDLEDVNLDDPFINDES